MDAPGERVREGARGAAQGAARDTTPIDRRPFVIGATIAAAVFAAAAAVALRSPRTLDERVLAWLAERRSQGLTTFFELLSTLGSWVVLTPLTILAVALLLVLRRRWSALLVGLCMTLEAVLDPALKSLVGLPRPGIDMAVKQVSGHGFPSGHAMAAATLSVALLVVAWPTRWRRPAIAGAVAWTVLIGLSRVYLGAHWPSDVVGGWAAGGALALGLCALLAGTLQGEAASSVSVEATPTDAGARPADAGAAAPVRVVLFDWGNTLMVDDGRRGRMMDWPRVAAVPGAGEVLAALHGRYRLCVATNADDSGADEVMAALGRVGLARFIDRVFSSRDLGARKPAAAFYAAVLEILRADTDALGEPPLAAEQVLMVGDSYENDVAGAAEAGLRAVWFNPARVAPPHPRDELASDAEICAFGELREVMRALGG